jgi:hypothetical protein
MSDKRQEAGKCWAKLELSALNRFQFHRLMTQHGWKLHDAWARIGGERMKEPKTTVEVALRRSPSSKIYEAKKSEFLARATI